MGKSENLWNIFIIPNAEDQLRARAHTHRLKFNLLSKDVGAVATVLVQTWVGQLC